MLYDQNSMLYGHCSMLYGQCSMLYMIFVMFVTQNKNNVYHLIRQRQNHEIDEYPFRAKQTNFKHKHTQIFKLSTLLLAEKLINLLFLFNATMGSSARICTNTTVANTFEARSSTESFA